MEATRVFITGAAGFSGRHLIAELRTRPGVRLTGCDVAHESPPGLDHYLACDLTDATTLGGLVRQAQPQVIYHLAGLFGASDPALLWRANVEGLKCLMAAARALGAARIIVVGSAAEIGPPGQMPVDESVACRPVSPYGQSKWQATQLALSEPADSPLDVIVARPFNLSGPGLSRSLALGRFAGQVADCLAGRADRLRCRNLDHRRDYLDVRDAVRAYVALAERGQPGQVYHVCRGRSYLIRDLLDLLLARAGRQITVEVEPTPPGAADVPDIVGDCSKLAAHTDWQPMIEIEQSLADMLAWEMARG